MALIVVAIHTNPFANCENQTILNIYNSILGLAVPFFFISTGFLLGKRMDFPYYEKNNLKVLSNHIVKITKLYLLWSAIYLPLAIIQYISSKTSFPKALLSYLRGLILVGENYNSWILWYLLSSIYALIFLYFLLKIKAKHKTIMLASLFIGIFISSLFTYLANNINNLTGAVATIGKIIKLTVLNGRILKGFFYIPLGLYLSKRQIHITASLVFFIVGYCLILINRWWLNDIGIAICSIGLFNVTININLKDSKIYPLLRTLSTVMYFMHLWVWSIYYWSVYREKTYGLDCFVITASVSIFIGVCFYLKKWLLLSKK